MYYTEFKRVKRIESMLEKLAYASVGSDLFVAVATFLVVKKLAYSSMLLVVGDYLIFVETAIAALIFAILVALKYYSKLADKLSLSMFRAKYARATRANAIA